MGSWDPRDSVASTGGSGMGLTDSQKAKYEERIKALEAKLAKAQEGKLDNTEKMLEVTQENSKLSATNQELTAKQLALQERLQDVE